MHPITYAQAIVLGLLQGAAELFPVSSLGHSVIAPRLLGWDIHQSDDFFLTFLVATHLATALVLLGFFWNDWGRIVRGLGRAPRPGDRRRRRRRVARLAAGHRHGARGAARAGARAPAAQGLRLAGGRRGVPVPQRAAAVRRRALAAPRPGAQ